MALLDALKQIVNRCGHCASGDVVDFGTATPVGAPQQTRRVPPADGKSKRGSASDVNMR